MSVDTTTIKQAIDCRQLIADSLGQPARRSGKVWQWRCCFHEDRQPSLTAYSDGWRCFGCDKHGDAIAWLQEREGLCFMDAVNRLAGGILPIAALPIAEPKPVTAEPPGEEWQTAAMAAVIECQERLWSGEGIKALKWLNARGLQDDTLIKWLIGFNSDPGQISGLYLDRGITIPCWIESENQLWYLKVRRASGEPKYSQVKGGKLGLFMADTLSGQRRAFICEGEFDALLLRQEIGDLAGVATFGSASAHQIDAWLPWLLPVEQFYIASDNDQAGQQMADYWLKATKRAVRAMPPAGKDLTDAFIAGCDLKAWAQAVMDEKDE